MHELFAKFAANMLDPSDPDTTIDISTLLGDWSLPQWLTNCAKLSLLTLRFRFLCQVRDGAWFPENPEVQSASVSAQSAASVFASKSGRRRPKSRISVSESRQCCSITSLNAQAITSIIRIHGRSWGFDVASIADKLCSLSTTPHRLRSLQPGGCDFEIRKKRQVRFCESV